MVTGMQVCQKMHVRVKFVCIFAYDDCVSFKEPVSLVARQEKSVGGVVNMYRVPFCYFSWVSKAQIVWVSHFSKAE